MSFLQTLFKDPGPHTPLSRYTHYNGVFYIVFGLSLYVYPGQLQVALGAAPFAGLESGMMRVIGFVTAIVGYFYVFGARTRSEIWGLSTVVDRLLVPLFVMPLVLSGAIEPRSATALAILDPVLGIGAYLVWRRSKKAAPQAVAVAN